MSAKKEIKLENKKKKLEAEKWLLTNKCPNDFKPMIMDLPISSNGIQAEASSPLVNENISTGTKRDFGKVSPEFNVEIPNAVKVKKVKKTVLHCVKDIGLQPMVALRKEVRKLKTDNLDSPIFSLTECGSRAQITLNPLQQCLTNPLFMKDIQDMVLFATLGNVALVKPRWCTFLRVFKVNNVILVLVEGASMGHIVKYSSSFKWCKQIFARIVEVFAPAVYKSSMKSELLLLQDKNSSGKSNKRCEKFKPGFSPSMTVDTLFPISLPSDSNLQPGVGITINDSFPRTELLLTLYEMDCERYPLPTAKGDSKAKFTKDSYLNVSPSSPMFAIDCEMCLTIAHKSELTRISIVNEDLECVYDSFVKPRNKIIDYRTQFSGITPDKLHGINTYIEEVQQEVSRILPPNAILIGQSLGNDLIAMNMMHPYVIDTSCIFNLTGVNFKKSKLRMLSQHLLNEDIQTNNFGHCSIEDSKAAMKLVQMKLKKGRAFGNVLLGGGVETPNPGEQEHIKKETSNSIITTTNPEPNFPCTNIFYHTSKWKKDVTVIGVSSVIDQCTTLIPMVKEMQHVSFQPVSTNHEVSMRLQNITTESDLSLAILDMEEILEDSSKSAAVIEKGFRNLDKRIAKVYKSLGTDDMLAVVFSGSTKPLDRNTVHNGLCMVTLKE